jgi:hypothetical protein
MALVKITSQLFLCKLLQSDFVHLVILSTLANNCIISFFQDLLIICWTVGLLGEEIMPIVRWLWSFVGVSQEKHLLFVCGLNLVLFGCSDMNY